MHHVERVPTLAGWYGRANSVIITFKCKLDAICFTTDFRFLTFSHC